MDRLNLFYLHKTDGNDSKIINAYKIAIVDKLLDYERLTKEEHLQ